MAHFPKSKQFFRMEVLLENSRPLEIELVKFAPEYDSYADLCDFSF
jgi:hypothetical protein